VIRLSCSCTVHPRNCIDIDISDQKPKIKSNVAKYFLVPLYVLSQYRKYRIVLLTVTDNLYHCTVHCDIKVLHSPTDALIY